MRDQMKEFEMLLNEVLDEVANQEPAEGLKQRVMMRLEMSAAQSSVVKVASAKDAAVLFEGGTRRVSLVRSGTACGSWCRPANFRRWCWSRGRLWWSIGWQVYGAIARLDGQSWHMSSWFW